MHGDWWAWLLIGLGIGYYLGAPGSRALDRAGQWLLRVVSRGKAGKR